MTWAHDPDQGGTMSRNDSVLYCPILDTLTTTRTASGNVYAGTGKAVPVNNKGAE